MRPFLPSRDEVGQVLRSTRSDLSLPLSRVWQTKSGEMAAPRGAPQLRSRVLAALELHFVEGRGQMSRGTQIARQQAAGQGSETPGATPHEIFQKIGHVPSS